MKTKVQLKEDREKVIELEDYTRRENLKFHNIPELQVLLNRLSKLFSMSWRRSYKKISRISDFKQFTV